MNDYLKKYCVLKNNLCLFTKGPLSQWWGGFKGQEGGFECHQADIFSFKGQVDNYLNRGESSLRFNCCEQWMMASKAALFDDLDSFRDIMAEQSPAKQKDLGRAIKNFEPEKWDKCKLLIVKRGNYFKFKQNPELAEFLKSFHPFTIFVEAAPWDKVWGIGLSADDPKAWDIHTWEGENLLGAALMGTKNVIDKESLV